VGIVVIATTYYGFGASPHVMGLGKSNVVDAAHMFLLMMNLDGCGRRVMAVIKEKKKSVQILCQGCKRLWWVKRGTLCHRLEVCGQCSQKISGRVLAKMKEDGEQDV